MKVKKEKYKRLTASALVVPMHESWMNKRWGGLVLPEGSVVRVLEKNLPSPITGQEDEITVKFVDLVKREVTGWLARNTPMKDSDKKKLSRNIGELRLAAWDTLREKMSFGHEWNAMTWIATFGHLNMPLLHAVIRELGGKVPKTDDPDTANVRVLRLILGKEISMSAVKKSRKAGVTKKSNKKGTTKITKVSTKKSKKQESPAGRTSAFSGKIIRRLVKTNPRREGSKGYKNWSIYKKGMTYEEFLKAGGARSCLAKDIERKTVKLLPAAK